MIYLGIDPGASGHIVAIDASGAYIDVIQLSDTERTIWEGLQEWTSANDARATVEQVHSMPGQGVASTFKFGQGYGFIRGLLVASCVPHEYVTPRKWQAAFGIAPKSGKEGNLSAAQQLYPDVRMSKTGKANAFYDALLLAEYGRRKHKGLL